MVLSRGRTGSVKVKILHFAHCFFPKYGGTTTRLYDLLTNEKNEHYLYVPQPPFMSVPDNIGALENEENFGSTKVRKGLKPYIFTNSFLILNHDGMKDGLFSFYLGHGSRADKNNGVRLFAACDKTDCR